MTRKAQRIRKRQAIARRWETESMQAAELAHGYRTTPFGTILEALAANLKQAAEMLLARADSATLGDE